MYQGRDSILSELSSCSFLRHINQRVDTHERFAADLTLEATRQAAAVGLKLTLAICIALSFCTNMQAGWLDRTHPKSHWEFKAKESGCHRLTLQHPGRTSQSDQNSGRDSAKCRLFGSLVEIGGDLHLDSIFIVCFLANPPILGVRPQFHQKMFLPSQKNSLWEENLQNPRVQNAPMLQCFPKLFRSSLHCMWSGWSRLPDLPDISALLVLSLSSAAVSRCQPRGVTKWAALQRLRRCLPCRVHQLQLHRQNPWLPTA